MGRDFARLAVYSLAATIVCLGCSDPDFARKRDDPNHHVVRWFVGTIIESSGCSRLNAGASVSVERDLFECVEDEDGWMLEVRNVRNGAELEFPQRPQLDYLAEYGERTVILDIRNQYAFWVDGGVLVGFSSMATEDVARFSTSEYHKPGVFEELWVFQNVSLGPASPPRPEPIRPSGIKSIALFIVIPLIAAFGVALFLTGYVGFNTGGDKYKGETWHLYFRPWKLFHEQGLKFIGLGVVGLILLLLVYLLGLMV